MQIVEYANIQFTKHDAVLRGMGFADLRKSSSAIEELSKKRIALKEG